MIPIRNSVGGLGNIMFKQAYLYAQVMDGMIPDVYVQDEKYFEKYKDDIKQMFGSGIGKTDDISLHIRRGDYVGNSLYVDLCSTQYYQTAVNYFPGAHFLVFSKDNQGSDDIDREWVEDFCTTLGIDFEFASGDDEVEDLNKMASCKGHIMANSSFSWWASYLGGGKVIYPKEWFTRGLGIPPLDNWITL